MLKGTDRSAVLAEPAVNIGRVPLEGLMRTVREQIAVQSLQSQQLI